MASKKCFKCGKRKKLEQFYRHGAMADGRLNKCKTCAKEDAARHRSENLERIRAYDRERGKLPHRIANALNQTRKWRANDRRRARCHNAVARALRNCELVPKDCEHCGNPDTVAHHDDYSKPLDIRWLCQPCHKQWHLKNKAK